MSKLIVGLDEVGRGCIAGPVVAAAVILDPQKPIEGLRDSKKLTEKKRLKLSDDIMRLAIDFSIGRVEVDEIDAINILQASLLAMERAFNGLKVQADFAQVDGIYYPDINVEGTCIKGGDDLVACISAASILAKVYRDDHMHILDCLYPDYGLAAHKGYPTAAHKRSLKDNGIAVIHRRTFSPVKQLLS